MTSPYDDAFFADIEGDAQRSAARVVPDLVALIHPRSVVDVGCGTGGWLRAFLDAGAERVLGIDGPHVDRDHLLIPSDSFMTADLEAPPALEERFDLAISLEVAEHLSAAGGDALVRTLSDAAPAVLFSAALPGQGGRHHINEQWLDHWVARFEAEGFEGWDCLRARYWDDHAVSSYYAQNAVLLLRHDHPSRPVVAAASAPMPWRVVHPKTLERHVRQKGLGDVLREAPRALRRTIAARRRRAR